MLRTFFMTFLLSVVVFGGAAEAKQKFTLSGRIEGLQPGDTLRFERIMLPSWETEPAFDIVVRKSGRFDYRGTQEHDQLYLMTYRPVEGQVRMGERSGKRMIVTDGDRVRLDGTVENIYYCTPVGGIYAEPKLAELLRVEDSLQQARNNLITQMYAFQAAGEKAKSDSCGRAFNLFYRDNPGVERFRSLGRNYRESHPEGTLYLLVESIPQLAETPTEKSRATYEALSPELKASYYGRIYADRMEGLARLAPGQPAPPFSLTTTDGRTITEADYRGKYLLIYHWGMCPWSMRADGQVIELYEKYRERGLAVVGVTESIATIQDFAARLPKDEKVSMVGISDIRPVLARMVEHGWPEAELETDHPENAALKKTYAIDGLPFFIFIGPDGTILARGYWEAFDEAQRVIPEALGD